MQLAMEISSIFHHPCPHEPQKGKKKKNCDFHMNYGHTTKKYQGLKNKFERAKTDG